MRGGPDSCSPGAQVAPRRRRRRETPPWIWSFTSWIDATKGYAVCGPSASGVCWPRSLSGVSKCRSSWSRWRRRNATWSSMVSSGCVALSVWAATRFIPRSGTSKSVRLSCWISASAAPRDSPSSSKAGCCRPCGSRDGARRSWRRASTRARAGCLVVWPWFRSCRYRFRSMSVAELSPPTQRCAIWCRWPDVTARTACGSRRRSRAGS